MSSAWSRATSVYSISRCAAISACRILGQPRCGRLACRQVRWCGCSSAISTICFGSISVTSRLLREAMRAFSSSNSTGMRWRSTTSRFLISLASTASISADWRLTHILLGGDALGRQHLLLRDPGGFHRLAAAISARSRLRWISSARTVSSRAIRSRAISRSSAMRAISSVWRATISAASTAWLRSISRLRVSCLGGDALGGDLLLLRDTRRLDRPAAPRFPPRRSPCVRARSPATLIFLSFCYTLLALIWASSQRCAALGRLARGDLGLFHRASAALDFAAAGCPPR